MITLKANGPHCEMGSRLAVRNDRRLRWLEQAGPGQARPGWASQGLCNKNANSKWGLRLWLAGWLVGLAGWLAWLAGKIHCQNRTKPKSQRNETICNQQTANGNGKWKPEKCTTNCVFSLRVCACLCTTEQKHTHKMRNKTKSVKYRDCNKMK